MRFQESDFTCFKSYSLVTLVTLPRDIYLPLLRNPFSLVPVSLLQASALDRVEFVRVSRQGGLSLTAGLARHDGLGPAARLRSGVVDIVHAHRLYSLKVGSRAADPASAAGTVSSSSSGSHSAAHRWDCGSKSVQVAGW